MTKRVNRTISTSASPCHSPGAHDGVTDTPNVDIENFLYVTCMTNHRKALNNELVAVSLSVMHERELKWVATII